MKWEVVQVDAEKQAEEEPKVVAVARDMPVAVLRVGTNNMALCFMECCWNKEHSDPLALPIKPKCVSLSVLLCLCAW